MSQNLITGGPIHNFKFRSTSAKGGKTASYPWYTTPVGHWFFKVVSKEDYDADKGRPSVPEQLKKLGQKWKTIKVYCEDTNQYGYYCEHLS